MPNNRPSTKPDPLNCTCNGWCDCHKPDWPKGETCDCRQRTDAEKEAERAESERVARALGVAQYEVIVGNVGSVYSGTSERDALLKYNTYVDSSKAMRGRCAGESVTVMRNDDVWLEYVGIYDQIGADNV